MAIDPQLERVVSYLVTAERQVAERMRSDCRRPWVNYATVQRAGKFDFSAQHQIFKRDGSNNDYISKRNNPDTEAKELQTAKLSGDYLAALERDYKARCRSRIRTLVHAEVTIPDSNGTNDGVIRKNTIDWFGRILTEEEDDS